MEKKKDNPAKMLAEAGAKVVKVETKAEPALEPPPLAGKYRSIADKLAVEIKAGKYAVPRTVHFSIAPDEEDGTLSRIKYRVNALRNTDKDGTSCKPALELINKLEAAAQLVGKKQQRNGNTAHDKFIEDIEKKADQYAEIIEQTLGAFYMLLDRKVNIGTIVGYLKIADRYIGEIKKLAKMVPPASQMVRTPRNLADQMQQGYRKEYALQVCKQLSLFPELPEGIKQKIKQKGGKEEEIYIGIDMDGAGWRLVETLQQLLHRHSQTTDQTAPDYYMGDYAEAGEKAGLIASINMDGDKGKTPVLITTPTELASIYASSSKPSGKQIKMAVDTLLRYSKQNYYIDYTEWYTEPYTDKNGLQKEKKKGRRIKGYFPLYVWVESEELEKEDATTTVKSRAIRIQLNPIWQRQIATHYNSKPADFMDRVINAYAKGTKKELPQALLPFLNKLVDAQHYKATDTVPQCTYRCKQLGTPADMGLYDMISPNWVKKREWKKLEQTLADFVGVAEKIGLLQKHWVETSKQDGKTVHFFQVAKFGEWK